MRGMRARDARRLGGGLDASCSSQGQLSSPETTVGAADSPSVIVSGPTSDFICRIPRSFLSPVCVCVCCSDVSRETSYTSHAARSVPDLIPRSPADQNGGSECSACCARG